MKTCRICGQVKPLDDFYRLAHTKDGRNSYCKPCHNAQSLRNSRKRGDQAERSRRWRARHADRDRTKEREANRRWKSDPKNRASSSERERLRKARLRHDQFIENVDRVVVLSRAEGLCGICGEPVDPTAFHVDHIVPLSRGGEHSYANTQPAHPRCNQRKYANVQRDLDQVP